jgi:mono/diheme cytochrome c family protein
MVNFSRPVWSLLGWACVAAGTFGAGVVYGQYANGTITVPLYGAGAAPAATEGEPQPEWAKRVESKVDKLLKLLEELDDKTPDKAAPVAAAGNALQAGAEACAKCHAADNYKEKGDGFQLFTADGSFREFSDRDVRKILKELESGTMPPPKSSVKIAGPERAALVEAFKPTNGRKP